MLRTASQGVKMELVLQENQCTDCFYISGTVHVLTHPSAPVDINFMSPSTQATPETPPG